MLGVLLSIKVQCIKSEMQYKVNFILMIISGIVTKIVSLGVPFILFQTIPNILGWNSKEIYLIMIYMIIAEGFNSLLFEGVWLIPDMVFSGKLDMVLTRPENPLLQVLSYGVGIQGIGNLIFGIPVLIYLHISMNLISFIDIMCSVCSVICGTIICLSVYLIFNSIAFWFDTGGRTSIPFTISSLGQYARYPITIYPIFMQVILCFVIPYAFMGMFPVMVLTHKIARGFVLSILMIAFVFMGFAVYFFHKGITKYESAGM